MMVGSLRYYRLRLGNASLPELAFRVRQGMAAGRLRVGGDSIARATDLAAADVAGLEMPTLRCRVDPAERERILSGGVYTLSADPAELRRREATLARRFCTDVTPGRAGCDIRQLWEPARLQHLAALIAAAGDGLATRSADAARRFVRESLFRWLDANPYPYGPHYGSAMECGLRIPVLFHALKFLTELSGRERSRLVGSIHRHAWWIRRRLSLHSSLGNHTVAECVGLVFAGAVFRQSAGGRRWLTDAATLLEKELPHQVLADGGPAEQSLNYHRFVLDLYGLAVDFLERNRLRDCAGMRPRLVLGEDFLSAFGDDPEERPSIGDSDDGYAVAPGVSPRRPPAGCGGSRRRTFRESGYTVVRTEEGLLATFDHGPLGMAPLYNHGHADALSVTVARGGLALLVDPGTYRYNGEPGWRSYFKGTRAHNTVTVDGADQAVQETGFLWSHPYSTRLTRCEERGDGLLVEALHDGYARLPRPVTHRRTVLFAREAGLILRDDFSGSGIHDFEINFHLHPDARAEFSGGGWRVSRGGCGIEIGFLAGGELRMEEGGRENPPFGWYSASYGTKRPAPVLQGSRRGSPGEVSFVTVISRGDAASRRELEETACRLSPAA